MEEYLQYMRTLRSQMNDVEDQAAKVSVEEQMHSTTIQCLEKDLNSTKSAMEQVKDDTELMMKEKGQICSQILEKQRKIALLESDSSTLNQTLQLVQQERTNLSARNSEKSSYYTTVADDISKQLQKQQDWVIIHMNGGEIEKQEQGNEVQKNLLVKFDTAKVKFNEISEMKSTLVAENSKIEHSVKKLKCKENEFKPELRALSIINLEEEYNALILDLAGETGFLQSLQFQIQQLKEISQNIKCSCGEEYNVAMSGFASL